MKSEPMKGTANGLKKKEVEGKRRRRRPSKYAGDNVYTPPTRVAREVIARGVSTGPRRSRRILGLPPLEAEDGVDSVYISETESGLLSLGASAGASAGSLASVGDEDGDVEEDDGGDNRTESTEV